MSSYCLGYTPGALANTRRDGTQRWPWEDCDCDEMTLAKRRMEAMFEFLDKLGVEHWCAPRARSASLPSSYMICVCVCEHPESVIGPLVDATIAGRVAREQPWLFTPWQWGRRPPFPSAGP